MHDQPTQLRCPKCGRPNVDIYVVNGVQRYEPHNVNGGTVRCFKGSHRRVER